MAHLQGQNAASLKKVKLLTNAEKSARSRSAQLKEENELLRKRHGDEATTVLQLEAQLRSLESQVVVLKKEARGRHYWPPSTSPPTAVFVNHAAWCRSERGASVASDERSGGTTAFIHLHPISRISKQEFRPSNSAPLPCGF